MSMEGYRRRLGEVLGGGVVPVLCSSFLAPLRLGGVHGCVCKSKECHSWNNLCAKADVVAVVVGDADSNGGEEEEGASEIQGLI